MKWIKINGWDRIVLVVSLAYYPAVQFLNLIYPPKSSTVYSPGGHHVPTVTEVLWVPVHWFIACWIVYFAAVWISKGFKKP